MKRERPPSFISTSTITHTANEEFYHKYEHLLDDVRYSFRLGWDAHNQSTPSGDDEQEQGYGKRQKLDGPSRQQSWVEGQGQMKVDGGVDVEGNRPRAYTYNSPPSSSPSPWPGPSGQGEYSNYSPWLALLPPLSPPSSPRLGSSLPCLDGGNTALRGRRRSGDDGMVVRKIRCRDWRVVGKFLDEHLPEFDPGVPFPLLLGSAECHAFAIQAGPSTRIASPVNANAHADAVSTTASILQPKPRLFQPSNQFMNFLPLTPPLTPDPISRQMFQAKSGSTKEREWLDPEGEVKAVIIARVTKLRRKERQFWESRPSAPTNGATLIGDRSPAGQPGSRGVLGQSTTGDEREAEVKVHVMAVAVAGDCRRKGLGEWLVDELLMEAASLDKHSPDEPSSSALNPFFSHKAESIPIQLQAEGIYRRKRRTGELDTGSQAFWERMGLEVRQVRIRGRGLGGWEGDGVKLVEAWMRDIPA